MSDVINGSGFTPVQRRIVEGLILWATFVAAGFNGALLTMDPYIEIMGKGYPTFQFDNEFLIIDLCIGLFFAALVFVLIAIIRSLGRVEGFDVVAFVAAAVAGFVTVFVMPWIITAVDRLPGRYPSPVIIPVVILPCLFAELSCWLAIRRQQTRKLVPPRRGFPVQ